MLVVLLELNGEFGSWISVFGRQVELHRIWVKRMAFWE